VVAEVFDQLMQRATVTEATQLSTRHCFMREDALAAVAVNKPDLFASIDFHAGVAIHGLAVEESAAVVGDDPDCLIHMLDALLLQGEFVFCGYGASYAGSCLGGDSVKSAECGFFARTKVMNVYLLPPGMCLDIKCRDNDPGTEGMASKYASRNVH
jgi:hypothetical protein